MKTLALLSTATLLIASPALFASPYISGQIGTYGVKVESPYWYNSDSDVHWGGTARVAGGNLWDINNCFKLGLEAGYSHYFTESFDVLGIDSSYKRDTVDVLAHGQFLPTKKLQLFAKAGPAYARQKESGLLWVSANAVVPKMVLGVGYDLTEKVNLNLSYNREFAHENVSSISTLNLGLNYNFL